MIHRTITRVAFELFSPLFAPRRQRGAAIRANESEAVFSCLCMVHADQAPHTRLVIGDLVFSGRHQPALVTRWLRSREGQLIDESIALDMAALEKCHGIMGADFLYRIPLKESAGRLRAK